MPDLLPQEYTIFRTQLIRIEDYRCAGYINAQAELPQGYEIVLTRSGAYERRDAHGTFLVDPNQVMFYNTGEPFDITHTIQGGDSSTVFVYAPSLLIEMMKEYNPDVENNPGSLFPRSYITFPSRLQTLQYKLLRADKRHLEPLAVEEEIIALTSEILRALHYGRTTRKSGTSSATLRTHAEHVHQVKTYLNANLQTALQLEDISSAVHVSPFHLSRIFKQITGVTLHQYVKRLRLFNAAERMLDHPTARLDILALEYGFSNHGNFSTAFRQTFGIKPSELRSPQMRQMSKILKA